MHPGAASLRAQIGDTIAVTVTRARTRDRVTSEGA